MDLIVDNGKPVEPSLPKKVVASLKGDNKLTIILSHTDVQKLVGQQIFEKSEWMKDYKTYTLEHNLKDNTYTVEYSR